MQQITDSKEENREQDRGDEKLRKSDATEGNVPLYFLAGLFLTSSSLQECSMILFGAPGVMPEWPLDQS
jgi:hypothetical protein